VVARLHSLVVHKEQQQQLEVFGSSSRPATCQHELNQHLQPLVKQAALAAAAGQEEQSISLLAQFSALHLAAAASGATEQQVPCKCGRWYPATMEDAVRDGLQEAAKALRGPADHAAMYAFLEGNGDDAQRASCFHPPGVYTSFLAAWVQARRQLQQLPQEVAATVVAAVKVAQQQRRRRQQQQQQQQRQQQQQLVQQESVGGEGSQESVRPAVPPVSAG
jgi:hypothetical protein